MGLEIIGINNRNLVQETMATLATAEACDSNVPLLASGDLRVLHPIFNIYGQRRAFLGHIVTLKLFEDNELVIEFIETKGEGRVLVIDGGGSMERALVGGMLVQLAQNMGWSGIIVNGCIRDVDEINGCDIGVRAWHLILTSPDRLQFNWNESTFQLNLELTLGININDLNKTDLKTVILMPNVCSRFNWNEHSS